MKKLTLLLTAVFLASSMVACTDKSADAPALTEARGRTTIDMVATHAIDLEFSVAQLTFVPNSAAPWLGRIILLDAAGHLYSTDIEGRDPKPVGSSKYIDIFGLAREAAPGVFLAITDNNKIEAFIESDDNGNFSPMIYSGGNFDALNFISPDKNSEGIRIRGVTGQVYTIVKKVNDQLFESTIIQTSKTVSPNDIQNIDTDTDIGIVGTSLSQRYFAIEVDNRNALIISPLWPSGISMLRANIINGLSVSGVEHIKYVASTQSNYGGGAYANGVLALVDADEQRIVFISLSYAERQLLKAFNPDEEVPQ